MKFPIVRTMVYSRICNINACRLDMQYQTTIRVTIVRYLVDCTNTKQSRVNIHGSIMQRAACGAQLKNTRPDEFACGVSK